MNPKPWYQSKTIIVAIVGMIAGAVMEIVGGEVTGAAGIATAITSAVMAILRTITTVPVTPTKG